SRHSGTTLAALHDGRSRRRGSADDRALGSSGVRAPSRTGDGMKVVFVSPVSQLGGAERSLLDLLWSIKHQDTGLEPRVLAFAEGPALPEFERIGVPVDVLELPRSLHELGETKTGGFQHLFSGATNSWRVPGFVLRIRSYFQNAGARVVHTNGLKAHLLAS